MNRSTLETLLITLIGVECDSIKCPIRRLQRATWRVETLLKDEFGMESLAKELKKYTLTT
jgi:hypothetical protein